jgi:ribosomal protein L24E
MERRFRTPSPQTALRSWSLVALVAVALALTPISAAGGTLGQASAVNPLPVSVCGQLRPIAVAGSLLCTHGPDPAPPGVDIKVPKPLVGGAHPQGFLFPDAAGKKPVTAAAGTDIGCYGNGRDGNRVQAVYAVPAGHPDRYNQVVPSIRQWAADTDGVFRASASATGGLRRIRFVTDTACNLLVEHVRLSASGADTFDNTIAELAAQGYDDPSRKYLVWMDATELCGIATFYPDDRKSPANYNNGGAPGSVERIDSGCWGLASQGESVEAHELMHSLGAVLPSAPHGSPAGHCNDSSDRMCYLDGTVVALLGVCGPEHEATFDCRNDDYFNTNPGAGNYLATHWNTADNSFITLEPGGLPAPPPPAPPPPPGQGYWFVASDGGIFAYGDARFYGSTGSYGLNQPIVGMAPTPSGHGYWLVARDGGIFAFGDAGFHGSTGAIKLNQPIVGMAATPSGQGYWFVAADGGIFAFGDAEFHGSAGGAALKAPIVAMSATPSGHGYWFAAGDGTVFAFGDAASFGTPHPSQPIVAFAPTADGGGYWLAGRDGNVYAFGNAAGLGSTGPLNQPVVSMAATPSGHGYWLCARDGGIFSFGDARFYGSTGNIHLNQPIVGLASVPEPG